MAKDHPEHYDGSHIRAHLKTLTFSLFCDIFSWYVGNLNYNIKYEYANLKKRGPYARARIHNMMNNQLYMNKCTFAQNLDPAKSRSDDIFAKFLDVNPSFRWSLGKIMEAHWPKK